MPRKKLGAEQKVARAIDLMELLAAARDGSMALEDLQRALNVERDEVEELVALVSTLADREAGTRAICYVDGDRAYLAGEAGRILPLRLTAAEGAVLDHEIDALDIQTAARERIRSSLLSTTLGFGGRVESTAAAGAFWQPLHEAIEDGVRTRILYRSLDADTAHWRTVDPLSIDMRGDRTYLLAWDTVDDRAKRYRLDKIEDLELTGESVERHARRAQTLGDSLAAAGDTARLHMPTDTAVHLTWAGITDIDTDGDMATVTVSYASERWLLSQILSFGGKARIVDDPGLAQRLIDYARTLTIDE